MIKPYQTHRPELHPTVRMAENASVIGKVRLDANVSIWYGAVLRGDNSSIAIGEGSNIQDNAICHSDVGFGVRVGHDVTVGHGAILHGCTIGDRTIVGMGSILLDGSKIGSDCIIAAGALVTPNTVIPDGVLVVGAPARVLRPLRPEELKTCSGTAAHYRRLAPTQFSPCSESEKETL